MKSSCRTEQRLSLSPSPNKQAIANEIREQQEFEEEMKRDAEEKKLLLQAVINEANESGYPMPKSLIKLMHSQNGNYFT